jgi:hypothetical protein
VSAAEWTAFRAEIGRYPTVRPSNCVAVARPERALGMYKGRHVFTDLDALKGLGDDVHTAALAMLRRQNELERAPEAR